MYTEMIFPNADIRFIAINNGADSDDQAGNDMTPFINIFNEFYAKETSRKIRAIFKAKGQAWKPLCTNPPYGYVKDPEDNIEGKISDDRFSKISASYEEEQHTLEIRVTELKALIATEKESSTNVDGFKIQRIRIVWNCIGEVVLPHKEKSA